MTEPTNNNNNNPVQIVYVDTHLGKKIKGAVKDVKETVNAQGAAITGAVNAQGQAVKDAVEGVNNTLTDQATGLPKIVQNQTYLLNAVNSLNDPRNGIPKYAREIKTAVNGVKAALTSDQTGLPKIIAQIDAQGQAVTGAINALNDPTNGIPKYIGEVKTAVGAVEGAVRGVEVAVTSLEHAVTHSGTVITGAVNAQGQATVAKGDQIITAVNALNDPTNGIPKYIGEVKTELTAQGKTIIAKENEILGAVNTQGDKITSAVDAQGKTIIAKENEILGAVNTQGKDIKGAVEAAAGAQITATKEAAEFLSEKVIGVGDKVGEVRIAVEGITDEVKGAVTDYINDQKSLRNKLYTAGYAAAAGAVAGLILAAASYFGKSSPNIEKTVKEAVQSSIDSSGTIESKIVKIPDVEEVQTHGHEYDKAGRLIVWARSKQPGKNPVYAQGIVENGADGLYKRLENTILPTADLTERIKFIESLTDGEGIITKTNIEARLKAYRGE